MTTNTYRAKIVSFEHGFYQIEVIDSTVPRHIRENNLRPWQVEKGLEVGDYGELVCYTTANSELWHLEK